MLGLSSSLLGQSFSGIITDSKNGSALPYASIGVKGKSIGGIADAKGQFKISIANAVSTDTIVVSYLGYQPRTFSKPEILKSAYDIKLIATPVQLHEVVALGKREVIIIGNKKPTSRYTGWGDYGSSRGRLRGVAIETNQAPLKLATFKMHLDACEFDSVRFRLHILAQGENHSGDLKTQLLDENVFFTAYKDQKWVSVDLSRYNLIVQQNVIVAVEWVDAWVKNEMRTESYLLTISSSRQDGYLYARKTPEEPFSVQKTNSIPTMYFETHRPGNINASE